MRAALLTREYPPDVYGGAGVHVEYLARELRNLIEVDVHAWGADRAGAIGHEAWEALAGPAPELAALRAMSIDLTMAAGTADADLVHSHTWYANFGGHLAKLVHDIPHVVTVHSLEPLRPWRAEAVDVEVDQVGQVADQILDVHPGTAVHLRRVLPGEHGHAHNRSPRFLSVRNAVSVTDPMPW